MVSGLTRVYVGTSNGYKDLATTITYNATIGTTWSGSGPYTQTISVDGILNTDNPIIDVILSDDTTSSKTILEAWSNVSRIVTGDGAITVYCYDSAPTASIPVQLKVVR